VADLVEKRGFAAPAVTIVGDVVKLRRELNWYETLPLFGQRVVVTRTRRQASALTEKLRVLGADVLEIATIRVTSLPLSQTQRDKLADLGAHFDWLIFTSPNAVDFFFEEFLKISADLRTLKAVKIATVGPATAAHLKSRHLQPDLQPGIYTAEKLAELFSETIVKGTRFCLPHGQLADPLLANHLRERGGQVEEWVLYDTLPEEEDSTGARKRYFQEGAQWITFTSSSTAENWHKLHLKPEDGMPVPKVVSMGPVTSATLRKMGYGIEGEAAASNLDSLVETIVRLSVESPHADD